MHSRTKSRARAGILATVLLSLTTFGLASPALADPHAPDVDVGAVQAVPAELASGASAIDDPQPVAGGLSAQRAAAAGESCSDSGDLEVCVQLGTGAVQGTDAAGRSAGEVGTQAIVPLPEWCLDAGWIDQGYRGTRTSLCGISSGELIVRRTQNGVTSVVGTMNFLVYDYAYMDTSWNAWAHQIQVSPTVITGAAAGTEIWGTATCSGTNCTKVNESFPVQTPGAMANASGESGYQWTGASGTSALGLPGWNISFKAPTTTNSSTLPISMPVPIRCDNAVPGKSQIGCVVPAITPVIRYDGTSFTEFGPHVAGAQASGLAGGTDANPLHRLVNATLQAQNRDTACPSSLPRPTGKSCDEYPFASTYEGAYLNGGGPRTQPWCQVTLSGTPSTGPTGYSVCMIDATQNSAAGSLLNSVLYVPYRVIDADAFVVEIV